MYGEREGDVRRVEGILYITPATRQESRGFTLPLV